MTDDAETETETPVIIPKFGMTMTDAFITQWLKSVGDACVVGEPILEVETDKTTLELEAPASGVLVEIRVPGGQEVPVGSVIGIIRGSPPSARRP
jgi:pyruvate/2-oxoglutarate dehydrogenase complex dihydrolipoamide acyltransferase (E2) component